MALTRPLRTPLRPRARARLLTGALAATLLIAIAACTHEDDTGSHDPAETTTTAASQFGSSMGITDASVTDVAALGNGPAAGETWSVPVGLNVCGRFLDPLDGGPVQVAGTTVTATAQGRVEIVAGDDVSGPPSVADYAEAVGVSLSTGTLSLPDDAVPAVLDSTDPVTQLAGATLDEQVSCGGVAASVQVWVYSAEAVESGDGILVVTEDPELVPFAQDAMAVVVAFSPETSLPTLPPSAMTGG